MQSSKSRQKEKVAVQIKLIQKSKDSWFKPKKIQLGWQKKIIIPRRDDRGKVIEYEMRIPKKKKKNFF